MNRQQDPDIAAAIREELILLVEHTPTSGRERRQAEAASRSTGRGRPRTRAQLTGAIATAVTVAVVLAASIAAITLSARLPGTTPAAPHAPLPSSIVVDGKDIPLAGVVTWSDAVVDPAHPRTITLEASGSVLHRTTWFCTLSQWRFVAEETSTAVRIEVGGYAAPLPATEYCNLVAPRPHEVRVTLDAPLGTRTLIDGSTRTARPALDASTVPTIAGVPSAFTQTVGWDQESGTATRTYLDPDRPTGGSVELTTGSPAALAASGAVTRAPDLVGIPVGGSTASLWRFDSAGGAGARTTRLEWTTADGRRLRLDVDQTPTGAQYTQAEVILLGRSVRSGTPSAAPTP